MRRAGPPVARGQKKRPRRWERIAAVWGRGVENARSFPNRQRKKGAVYCSPELGQKGSNLGCGSLFRSRSLSTAPGAKLGCQRTLPATVAKPVSTPYMPLFPLSSLQMWSRVKEKSHITLYVLVHPATPSPDRTPRQVSQNAQSPVPESHRPATSKPLTGGGQSNDIIGITYASPTTTAKRISCVDATTQPIAFVSASRRHGNTDEKPPPPTPTPRPTAAPGPRLSPPKSPPEFRTAQVSRFLPTTPPAHTSQAPDQNLPPPAGVGAGERT